MANFRSRNPFSAEKPARNGLTHTLALLINMEVVRHLVLHLEGDRRMRQTGDDLVERYPCASNLITECQMKQKSLQNLQKDLTRVL